ncbi:MAG: hypothetical protein IJ968_01330 [Clostridia bacterium]|nr:hypothetical protein [Clostridia bacterium]
MEKDRCILCGEPYSTGLHVMGCLICFPCERRLLHGSISRQNGRKLKQIYASAHLEG